MVNQMDKKAMAESFIAMAQEAAKDMPPHPSKLGRKSLFLRFIDLKNKAHDKERALCALGLDPYSFNEEYCGAITSLLYLVFTPAQVETIEWWLYEDVEKIIHEIEPNQIDHIMETPEQLWEYLNLPNGDITEGK